MGSVIQTIKYIQKLLLEFDCITNSSCKWVWQSQQLKQLQQLQQL